MCQKSLKLGARNSDATKVFLKHTLIQTVVCKVYPQLLAESRLKIETKASYCYYYYDELMTQIFHVKGDIESNHRTAESSACEQVLDVRLPNWEFDLSTGLASSNHCKIVRHHLPFNYLLRETNNPTFV